MKVTPAVAGAAATLATWFGSALVLRRLEPTLGSELADVLMLLAGAVGVLAYGPVKAAVERWQNRA